MITVTLHTQIVSLVASLSRIGTAFVPFYKTKMMRQEDDGLHQNLRRQLVNGIREKGISDQRVLEAIFHTPRQWFMPPHLQEEAYIDKAFPIGEGQTISQPYTVAYQTQLLALHPSDRVLEIGTGSGYQAVILAQLAAEVFSIERQKKLYNRNQSFAYLNQFSNLHLFYGDGYEGLRYYAPFDKILITAAAPHIPEKLVAQLKRGGLMVLPLGKEHPQKMVRITRLSEDEINRETFDDFSFVPMLTGRND
jgi:protein-L-isoaspartate(D-aspartate) O-methyltransferase